MPKLNITEAAKAAQKSRTTIYDYIKQGKLSCEVNADGQKVLDPAELIRVFGEIERPDVSSGEHAGERPTGHERTPVNVQNLQEKVKDLERDNAHLRKDNEELRQEKAELKEEKKELLGILKQQTLLLLPEGKTGESEPKTKPREQKTAEKKRGWFSWLFGGAA